MKTDEALRLALEALEKIAYVTAMDYEYQRWAREAITAIKAALEAKDEAVAWMWMPTGEVTTDPDRADGMWEPLFLAPPPRTWVGLDFTDLASVSGVEVEWERHWEKVLKGKNT